ncbi:MAG: hypothetical protein K8S99_10920 [Planctomycetes bacterium]|nr:hypothetical protein [Planctomycetota bacterium]
MQYPQIAYVPEGEDPSITIRTRDLTAKIIDNTGLLAPPVPPGHKAYFNPTFRHTPFTHHLGYHGIRTFYDNAERRNIVAAFVSWLNLQGVQFAGITNDPVDERSIYGFGRGWPIRMERAGEGVRLTIDPMPVTQFRYTLELQPAEPDGIDFSFQFVFGRRPDKGPSRFVATWPCYMNAYDDVRLFYPRGTADRWEWATLGEKPDIIIGETVGYEHKQNAYTVEQQAFPLAYGLIGDRTLAIMFDDPAVEFFCVNSGGHAYHSAVQNPAWDWKWTADDYPLDTPMGFSGRLIYTPSGPGEKLVERYREWARSRSTQGATR